MAIALPKQLTEPMSPAKRAWEARKLLPPGHVEIARAKEKLKQEYAMCSAQEEAFEKKWKKKNSLYIEGYQEIADFAASLCRALGTKPIKMVMAKEPGTEYAGAYYKQKTIYCNSRTSVRTIVHETTHHIMFLEYFREYCNAVHGEKFCEVEGMLFAHLLGEL